MFENGKWPPAIVSTAWRRILELATKCRQQLRRLNRKQWALLGLSIFGVAFLLHIGWFLWPRSVSFSYASPTCFSNPTFFPRHHSASPNSSYTMSTPASTSLKGYPLYSAKTCVQALEAPEENKPQQLALKPFGLPLVHKSITVVAATHPSLRSPLTAELISTKDALTFQLTTSDQVFDYLLEAGDKSIPCQNQAAVLFCDIASLKLNQGATYMLSLHRLFRGKMVDTLFAKTITTTSPVEIVSSSVPAGSTIFDKPAALTIKFNKTIRSLDGAALYLVATDGKEQPLKLSATLAGDQATIAFTEPLPRNASFRLHIPQITATDNGFLPVPYNLSFKTSGGPKVTNVNIGSYAVSTAQRIILTFDSPPSDKQIAAAVFIETAGGKIASTVSVSGNRVTIVPTASLPRCTNFTVKVANGLENTFGVAGGSAWQYSSRTLCQTTTTIGTSLQGRSITAYRFGSGPSKIIYVGATHGNEQSSKYTLDSWIDDLERNYQRIPANRTIIVIPSVNPDGVAAGSRFNARPVDLNRNFPANDWKQSVTVPGGTLMPSGGGTAPLSEPESNALANYVLAQSPRLVLTYHAVAAIVIANESGDSRALATTYAQKSRYQSSGNSESSSNIFDYDTTGAFENWLHDKHSIPALLVELATSRSNEFTRNQSAMWAMAELP